MFNFFGFCFLIKTEQLKFYFFCLGKKKNGKKKKKTLKENRLKIGTMHLMQIKWNKPNPFYFFNGVSNCKKPDDLWKKPPYVLKNNKFRCDFVLLIQFLLSLHHLSVPRRFSSGQLSSEHNAVDRLTYLRWVMTNNLDVLTNEINVLAVDLAYLIIRKVTVRSKILLLLHISPLFILFSFLVTSSLTSRCYSLLFNTKNEKCVC